MSEKQPKSCNLIRASWNLISSPINFAKLSTLTANIKAILTTLKSEGAAVIVVDRYYAVTQGDPACLFQRGIAAAKFTTSDYNWMTMELDALNAAIAKGVSEANVGAKLITPNFSGHGVCDATPWVAGPGLHDGAAEHPTAAGQKYLAKINEAAL